MILLFLPKTVLLFHPFLLFSLIFSLHFFHMKPLFFILFSCHFLLYPVCFSFWFCFFTLENICLRFSVLYSCLGLCYSSLLLTKNTEYSLFIFCILFFSHIVPVFLTHCLSYLSLLSRYAFLQNQLNAKIQNRELLKI